MYRYLEMGERMQPGDEYFCTEFQAWCSVPEAYNTDKICVNNLVVRRKISDTVESPDSAHPVNCGNCPIENDNIKCTFWIKHYKGCLPFGKHNKQSESLLCPKCSSNQVLPPLKSDEGYTCVSCGEKFP